MPRADGSTTRLPDAASGDRPHASWRSAAAAAAPVAGPIACVVGTAWGLWTIRRLVGVVRSLLAGDGPAGQVVRILRFRNTPDGPIIDGFGLSFAGWGGVALASVQLLVIASAILATFVPLPRGIRAAMLLAGLVVAATWAGSFAWVLAWSFDVASLVLTAIHVAGFLAMTVVLGWRCRRPARTTA